MARFYDVLWYRDGAGWVVPKKVVEKVGAEQFKQAPIGAGPTSSCRLRRASNWWWRHSRVIGARRRALSAWYSKVIPDESTRLAALKTGEVDIVYSIRGELAEELRSTPGLTLKPAVIQGTFWLAFVDQWDPKSPWSNDKVRRAASLAIDRDNINKALTLGYSRLTGNPFVPDTFDYYWQPPDPVYDPAQAEKLLAEAGYANGFEGGDILLRCLILQSRRGDRQQSRAGRNKSVFTAAGTGSVLQGLYREAIQEPRPGRQRSLWQRRNPPRNARREGRRVCLRQLPGP